MRPMPPRRINSKETIGPSSLKRSMASRGMAWPVRACSRKARKVFLDMNPVSRPATLNPLVLMPEVAGKLAIKGTSQDITVPVAMAQAGATTTATGAFAIKRLAFKIGENEWADTSMVADDVQVKFKFALTGVGKI